MGTPIIFDSVGKLWSAGKWRSEGEDKGGSLRVASESADNCLVARSKEVTGEPSWRYTVIGLRGVDYLIKFCTDSCILSDRLKSPKENEPNSEKSHGLYIY
jgi:hypothetical protein